MINKLPINHIPKLQKIISVATDKNYTKHLLILTFATDEVRKHGL